jgi:hypothetical protein
VINGHAAAAGVDVAAMHAALDDGSAYVLVDGYSSTSQSCFAGA